jgi:hypothetical protein
MSRRRRGSTPQPRVPRTPSGKDCARGEAYVCASGISDNDATTRVGSDRAGDEPCAQHHCRGVTAPSASPSTTFGSAPPTTSSTTADRCITDRHTNEGEPTDE